MQGGHTLQHNFSMQHRFHFFSLKTAETTFLLGKRKVMLRCIKPLLKASTIGQMKSYRAEMNAFWPGTGAFLAPVWSGKVMLLHTFS
jgi:hypothetical protein